MKRDHAPFTKKNNLPRIERDIAEQKIARKALEILIVKKPIEREDNE